MTSLSRSFQLLSPFNDQSQRIQVGARQHTPRGGLVNHKVHVLARGCLTLKLLASWKTVTGPSWATAPSWAPFDISEAASGDSTAAAILSECQQAWEDILYTAERGVLVDGEMCVAKRRQGLI